MQGDIQSLKAANESNDSPTKDEFFEEAIAELTERNKRKNNLILFGVPEPNSNKSASERATEDKSAVIEIVKVVYRNIDITTVKPVRLGSYAEGLLL
nr:unnamed protein product [Callosobruchus analis]